MAASKDIVESIRATGARQSVRRVQLQRRLTREPKGAAQLRFAEEMGKVPAARVTASHVHPGGSGPELRAQVRAQERNGQSGPQELSPADLVWLQRLPRDPREVTHADASRVAGLAASTSMLTPSSKHLVESIWEPIREIHDLKAAKHELEMASAKPPSIPASGLRALVEAVRAEHRDWPDVAVEAHASDLFHAAVADRDAEHASAKVRAQERVEQLEADARERIALIREVAS